MSGTLFARPIRPREGWHVANDPLRRALTDATMTDRDLARACGVDLKTVERWIAHEERLPHQRHRWAVCEALGVDEAVIWPDAVRSVVKTGVDREITAAYAHRSAIPKSLWRRLVTTAAHEIALTGYTNYFFWLEHSGFGLTLRRKAEAGCRIRCLMGDPDSDVTRRREEAEGVALTVRTRIQVTLDELSRLRDVVEVRFSDEHIAMSVFRFDGSMIVTQHLAHLVGHDSPALHLTRHQDNGLFDRFSSHVDTIWNTARPMT